MPNKNNKNKSAKSKKEIPLHFHARFGIGLDIKEAKKRFMNRIDNYIFNDFFYNVLEGLTRRAVVLWQVANAFGISYDEHKSIRSYVGRDFYKYIQAVEVTYNALKNLRQKERLNNLINLILEQSEIDLGINWENSQFIRKGARLLDQELVNEPLRWLAKPEYENVYNPFAKGLSHFIKAEKDLKLLHDVITDMYEALEGLSKIITGKHDKDLSANAELFISKIKVSQNYKKILKEYISYANEFRHAPKKEQKRPKLSINEVESFVYLTGLFIRLAIEGWE
ncbi:unnamed protein product [marine sediment metagenome]|uniref:Uncharacterized protein n=1 Tax=marine sediment metagenome TaxID=412755 RepID=X1H7F5_9ZZZZ